MDSECDTTENVNPREWKEGTTDSEEGACCKSGETGIIGESQRWFHKSREGEIEMWWDTWVREGVFDVAGRGTGPPMAGVHRYYGYRGRWLLGLTTKPHLTEGTLFVYHEA